MADAPPTKAPNKGLALFLILVTAFGTLGFMGLGLWKLLTDERIPGFGWFSLGLGWFLVLSWRLRAALRPLNWQ